MPFGLQWSGQDTQMSYIALLCRREHRFTDICWFLGQKLGRPEIPCGSLWQPWARSSGGLKSPVAACGSLLQPSRSPIEEDKMIRFRDSSILSPGSWIQAAWVPGGWDSSISAPWLPGLAGLMSSSGPCFEGWEMERTGCCRQGGVV